MQPNRNSLSIAVAGLGLIGRRHVTAIEQAGHRVHSVADPSVAARDFARERGLLHVQDLGEMIAARPDGIVLATPNALHEAGALACIEAGVPVLVEKPVAVDPAAAKRVVAAAKANGVAALAGHHRRHTGVIRRSRDIIQSGELGRIVSVHASFWLAKPDAYFDADWRRMPGGGPVMINLIHEIDLLRHLVGEIVEVHAMASQACRGFDVEDTFVASLRFDNGALGTLQVSDTIVAPWSWELTAHDNPAYPPTGENSLFIGGTKASLALPRGEIWSDDGRRDWWQPISRTVFPRDQDDPLVRQIGNFAGVIMGFEEPVCSADEGMKSLTTLMALHEAGRLSAERAGRLSSVPEPAR